MNTDNLDFDLSVLDQLAEDLDDEIFDLVFQDDDQNDKFDHAMCDFHNKFLDTIRQCRNEEMASTENDEHFSDEHDAEVASNFKSIEKGDIEKNQNVQLKKDCKNTESKGDISKKCDLNTDLNNLLKAGIELESIQLLDNFDDVFEPIHSDKILLPEIIPEPSDQSDEKSEIAKKSVEESSTNHVYQRLKYIDYAKVSDGEAMTNIKTVRGRTGRTQQSFPHKLHFIVERSEVDGYTNIISWLPHGRAFKIHDCDLFLETIMPRFFYQTKMPSFIRQLSSYGFQKFVASNTDKGAYFHELFLRGRPGLCNAIIRHQKRPLLDPTNEPKLEAYEPMPPCDLTPKSKNSTLDTTCTNKDIIEKAKPRIIRYADPCATRRLPTLPQSNNRNIPASRPFREGESSDVITFLGTISGQNINIYPYQPTNLTNMNASQNLIAQNLNHTNLSQNLVAQRQLSYRTMQGMKKPPPSTNIVHNMHQETITQPMVAARAQSALPSTYSINSPPSNQKKISYLKRRNFDQRG